MSRKLLIPTIAILLAQPAWASSILTADKRQEVETFKNDLENMINEFPSPPSTGGARSKQYNFKDPTFVGEFKTWNTKHAGFLNSFPQTLKNVVTLCQAAQAQECVQRCGRLDAGLEQASKSGPFKWDLLFVSGLRLAIAPCVETLSALVKVKDETITSSGSASPKLQQRKGTGHPHRWAMYLKPSSGKQGATEPAKDK